MAVFTKSFLESTSDEAEGASVAAASSDMPPAPAEEEPVERGGRWFLGTVEIGRVQGPFGPRRSYNVSALFGSQSRGPDRCDDQRWPHGDLTKSGRDSSESSDKPGPE